MRKQFGLIKGNHTIRLLSVINLKENNDEHFQNLLHDILKATDRLTLYVTDRLTKLLFDEWFEFTRDGQTHIVGLAV